MECTSNIALISTNSDACTSIANNELASQQILLNEPKNTCGKEINIEDASLSFAV